MKFTIKDKRFIQKSDEVLIHLNEVEDVKIARAVLRGLTNISKIEENKTEFEYVNYNYNSNYLLIENKELGAFIVREDNVNEIEEVQDVLNLYGIEKIIKSGDKTILLNENGEKFITTRAKEDEYDIEKAVMILLLKEKGYAVTHIYDIISTVK